MDVYHPKICSGGERATEECRVDKGGNAEEEARRRIRTAGGGEGGGKRGRGMGNRKGVVHNEGSSVRIIFTEVEEKEDEDEEVETLPLFVVAGETKNRG